MTRLEEEPKGSETPATPQMCSVPEAFFPFTGPSLCNVGPEPAFLSISYLTALPLQASRLELKLTVWWQPLNVGEPMTSKPKHFKNSYFSVGVADVGCSTEDRSGKDLTDTSLLEISEVHWKGLWDLWVILFL